jgi:hypothetical protein
MQMCTKYLEGMHIPTQTLIYFKQKRSAISPKNKSSMQDLLKQKWSAIYHNN